MASDSDTVIQALRRAARGASDDGWLPPAWLLGHQPDAALRIAGSLQVFGGALLADAVGLGKTYVSLAVSTRYHRTAAIVPASLVSQWRDVAERLGTPVTLVSHEALSRGRRVPQADLIIVDEAHRFRNSASRRYDRLARDRGRSHLLLVTATPVVNHCRDLVSLLHLFLADNSLAILGLPSLEQAVADRDYTAIAHASAPLVVARSTRVLSEALSIPHPTDRRVSRTPSLPIHDLERLTDDIGSLTFPGTGVRQAVELLRAHLLHRLASSPAACRETLRRHLAYLDRALAAFANGQAIARGTARQLLGHGDDLQLELVSLIADTAPTVFTREEFEEERERVLNLLERLPRVGHRNPKAECLRQILQFRCRRRTIVFVTAVSTALDLARRLEWRRIGVVGGGRAWIASGRITVDTALQLFAPRARRAPTPEPSTTVATLIATDLVSEGLDLQDADGIVHYDLPWTPLRLAQRLGRVARLGSEHHSAHVYWFAPPPVLERQLQTARRIREKHDRQLRLGVPVTSTVGRARITNTMFEYREQLLAPPSRNGGHPEGIPATTVVGPPGLLLAVAWERPEGTCRELVTFAGDPPRIVRDYRLTHTLVRAFGRAGPSPRPITFHRIATSLSVLKSRLWSAQASTADRETLRLRREIMREGRLAGQRRKVELLRLLDAVLDRLTAGLCVGAMRELSDVFDVDVTVGALGAWLERHPEKAVGAPVCHIEGLLVSNRTAN